MVTIPIKKLTDSAKIPTRGSEFAAGYDLYSTEKVLLAPGDRHAFKTGISVAIPTGFYGRIAPRSGLAFKYGIDTLAGVIDPDYRGEILVILINHGSDHISLPLIKDEKETPIAQIIFENYSPATFPETSDLPASVRGEGGFGSTDVAPKETPPVAPVEAQGALKTFTDIVNNLPGASITEIYQKGGGIPIKKRYSDEMRERERQQQK